MYIQATEQIRSIHKTKLQCSEKKSNFVHKTEQYVPKKTEQVWLGKREEFTVAFNKNEGCGWVGWDGWLGWLGGNNTK